MRDCPRGAAADGIDAMGRFGRAADRRKRRGAPQRENDHLRRADRRQKIQPAAEYRRKAQTPARVDGARAAGQAPGHAGDGDGPFRIRAQRARPRHGARPRRSATHRWRDGRCGRGELSQQSARLHQDRRQERFCRRRVREAVAGSAGRQSAQGHVEARSEASGSGRLLRSHAHPSKPRHAARRFERRGCEARVGRTGRALDLSASVSHARINRCIMRRRGCEVRQPPPSGRRHKACIRNATVARWCSA